MAEVPEHLLRRSAERRKALGLPGGEGEETTASSPDAPASEAAGEPSGESAPAEVAASAESEATSSGDAETASGTKIPAHLLERAKRRKAAAAGGEGGAVAAGAAATATATIAAPPAGVSGPGGHTQRLLTVVKSGSIQQAKGEAQDKVHVWPHLLVIELASILILLAFVTIFSATVRAPLLALADFNQTPNPSNKPDDRRFAIAIFTLFVMMFAAMVIIGSFFRGPGFNFTFPWKDGIFFEL